MTLNPNSLIQSDSLLALERIPSESVDLVYLDPPWPYTNPKFSPLMADEYYTYIFKVLQQA